MPGYPAGAAAERRLIERLLTANAMSGSTAAPLDELRWVETRRLPRLVRSGVVREASPGRYYLDAPSLAQRMIARRRRLALVFILIAVAGGLVAALAGGAAVALK